VQTKNSEADGQSQFNHYPHYAPRIWHGMSTSSWLKLAASNRFKIDRFEMAAWVTFFGLFNSVLNRTQTALYKWQSVRTPLADDPIFIIGHWRTGTTLLHTLMSLDQRYAAPNNYQCFTPRHFLLSERWCTQFLNFPRRRPMDNMDMGWHEPQEDELALCVLGFPSVFRNNAFPKHPKRYLESLTMEAVSRRRVKRWQRGLLEFVRYLNLRYRRPLVLKSPPHTGRIRTLLEIFPNARFMHITRSPMEFIPSTMHLWKALNQTNGFQKETENVDCQDYVFECYRRMYDGFHAQKPSIPERNFCQIRFDELISDPLNTLRDAYEKLRLADFEEVAPTLDQFMQRRRNYQRNSHAVPPRLAAVIRQRCADYIEQFGYESVAPAVKAA
jgi:hypothetical protein